MNKLLPGRSYVTDFLAADSPLLEGYELIDRLWVDGTNLGAKEARELVALASQQPFGPGRLLVIANVDSLSEQVQNTFLKLFEEPPLFLTIIVLTKHRERLLPTIQSRLHQLVSQPTGTEALGSPFATLAEGKKELEKIKDRPALISFFERNLRYYRDEILEKPVKETFVKIDLLDRSIRRLQQNANQKLVVEAFLLNWPGN